MRSPSNKYQILVSYALWNNKALEYQIIKDKDIDLFLDSGAFTNYNTGKEKVKLDDYIHFIKEHKQIVWNYINLDVIGDEKQSEHNYQIMKNAGLNPIPVFTRMNITPKKRAEILTDMCNKNPFIALGGVAGMNTKKGFEYLKNVCHFIKRNTKTKFHILGCGSLSIAQQIKPYSMDSSTSSLMASFGEIGLFDKNKCGVLRIGRKTKKSILIKNAKLIKKYGLNPKILASDLFWNTANNDFRACLNLYSYFKMQQFLKRHNVTHFQALTIPHLKLWDQMVEYYNV